MTIMESYVIYWPATWVKTILKNGDGGPLTVIYGGEHISQPALGKVGVGDIIYPVTVADGQLYVMARMTVSAIVDADEYTEKTLGLIREPMMWDEYTAKHKAAITHKIPRTCADNAAISADGTPIVMRPFPTEKIPLIRLGTNPGKELPLKMRGALISMSGLQGHFRRMSEETAILFAECIDL
jgi:hypothetical protein